MAGREILIKAVAQTISSYTMPVIKLHAGLRHSIQLMITKFWWSNTKEGCIYWKKWQHLCQPKSEGGMGFRDLIKFNQALLAKQGRRLIQNSDSLLGKKMKAKYFPNSSFFNASLGHNPSYVWRSLIWGRELLKIGLRWGVGSGSSIRAFIDPWLMRPITFKPITIPANQHANLTVEELRTETRQWNWMLINECFWPIDHEEFRKIPIHALSGSDRIIWHYNSNGIYSVKSGYHLAMTEGIEGSEGPRGRNSRFFKLLWHLNIQNKIKIFIWRVVHSILPTRLHLATRRIHTDKTCPLCLDFPEHSYHTFWLCAVAQDV